MARTTSDAVSAVLGRQYDGSTDLSSAIATATAMVDQVVSCASSKGITIGSTLLERIEAFLAAHYYGVADQLYQSKQTSNAGATFQGKTSTGIKSTLFGQQAISLDPSGCLAATSRGRMASLFWTGKPKSEQIDYVDRD